MTFLEFDPDNTLAGGLFAMTGKEAISLGKGLCAAVERAVGADGTHGGVWPGNITWADGQVAVGPRGGDNVAELSSDALEYVAPEQFWIGASTPASDVYSIGLVLYTALNKGVKPFFKSSGDSTPEDRADAMQSRMKGVALPCPATASRALGDVVLKAVSFQASDRYASPGQLRAALDALPASAEVPAEAPLVHLTEAERQNAPNYKVDKSFEQDEPPAQKRSAKKRAKKRNDNADLLATLGIVQENGGKTEQVVHALVTGRSDTAPERRQPETPAEAPVIPAGEPETAPPQQEAPLPAEPQAPAADTPPAPPPKPKRRQKGEVDENMDVEEFRNGRKKGNWARAVVPILLLAVIVVAVILLVRGCNDSDRDYVSPFNASPTPTESLDPQNSIHAPVPEPTLPVAPAVTQTPEPTPEITPEPTEPPEPTYELFMANVSWTQARDLCEQKGGHLATVRNDEEMQKIIDLATANGAQFVWLGAFRGDSSTWYYVTGERMDYAVWDTGEPSALDMDGTREDYLLMWYRTNRGGWYFNDQRNDPVSLLPATYNGKTAYVCQYDG